MGTGLQVMQVKARDVPSAGLENQEASSTIQSGPKA